MRIANRDSVGGRHRRERRMMGRREEGQGQFFYSFDLDKVVPPDHLVRQIAGLLDRSGVPRGRAPFSPGTGRPSIDPVLMIRMLLIVAVCLHSARSGGYALKSRSGLPVVLQARH